MNGWNVHSIVCRGADPSGHWANHPRPAGEQVPVKGAVRKAQGPTPGTFWPVRPLSEGPRFASWTFHAGL
eukprot:SAG22_NODE_429_length_10587_cov_22.842582_2_plen_70_part_00